MKAKFFFRALRKLIIAGIRAAFTSMQFLCPGNFSILAMPLVPGAKISHTAS